MAKYRVLEKSYINGRIYEEGEIVEYDGEASDNLEPIKVRNKSQAQAVDGDDVSNGGSTNE
jgi:hypothetical protein